MSANAILSMGSYTEPVCINMSRLATVHKHQTQLQTQLRKDALYAFTAVQFVQ